MAVQTVMISNLERLIRTIDGINDFLPRDGRLIYPRYDEPATLRSDYSRLTSAVGVMTG